MRAISASTAAAVPAWEMVCTSTASEGHRSPDRSRLDKCRVATHRGRAVINDDYLMRMIQRVAEAIERAFGVQSTQPNQAFELLDDAWDGLVTDRQLFSMLDARSAVGMVEGPQRLDAIIRLLEAEAGLHERAATGDAAASLRKRADELRAAGQQRWGSTD